MKIDEPFKPNNDLPLMQEKEGLVLFRPHIPRNAIKYVNRVLRSRWIGQGPRVDEFEREFKHSFRLDGHAAATGSGTDALHLAYLLAGIGPGDEVLAPVFTCTATNIPLLYAGAKIKFIDVDPNTLNMDVNDLRAKISGRTKAIVIVHYGGLPCDMTEILSLASEFDVPVIQDSAHALGAEYENCPIGNLTDYSMYSFQAIKHLTTGDGGMLVINNTGELEKLKRLRWFGIDREKKQNGVWENDITEVGYKYQMTDIAAAMGLAALEEFPQTLQYRRALYYRYVENLKSFPDVQIIDDFSEAKKHAAWLFSIRVKDRKACQLKLRSLGIESGQTHFRNDRYSIFSESRGVFPGMDLVDEEYLILPLHTMMTNADVDRVCGALRTGW